MNIVETSLNNLYSYCNSINWEGFDPFDGLNSKLFQSIPFIRNQRFFRQAFLQVNKKLMINIRPVFLIKRGRNPKGVGIFLLGLLNLYMQKNSDEYLNIIKKFVEWLKEDVSPGFSGCCWGYNFDWQSRAFFLPKGTPTVVNTSFIARAFLKAYEVFKNEDYLRVARSACDFILNDLNRLDKNDLVGFSYSPIDRYFVNNATALASSLLASVYSITGEKKLMEIAKKSIQYVIYNQQKNGSWKYAEDRIANRVGIDNFHTGFILESIKIYADKTGDKTYLENIKKGLNFYQQNFFLKNGAPKYFNNKIYPLDIHSAAQAIITLLQLKTYGAEQNLCRRITNWMINNMQDEKGYFYYQKKRLYTIKIEYVRWNQAWTLLALSTYLISHGK